MHRVRKAGSRRTYSVEMSPDWNDILYSATASLQVEDEAACEDSENWWLDMLSQETLESYRRLLKKKAEKCRKNF